MNLVGDCSVLLLAQFAKVSLLFKHLFPSGEVEGLLAHHLLKVFLIHHTAQCVRCSVCTLGESALAEIMRISVRTPRWGKMLLAGRLAL